MESLKPRAVVAGHKRSGKEGTAHGSLHESREIYPRLRASGMRRKPPRTIEPDAQALLLVG